MFTRPIRPLLLGLILLCTATVSADTTLFEVTKGDQRLLLGGTIHLLHPDDYPLPEAFEAAYQEADALYLETDLDAVESPAFGQKLSQAMRAPAGQTLEEALSAEVWSDLEAYAREHRFPLQQFAGFDPIFVGMVMTVNAAQQRGIREGVDHHFWQKAKADELPRGQLETTEDVLAYMKAMTGQEGDAIIEATLAELEQFDEMMETTVAAWKRGDLDALDRDLGEPMRQEAPQMYERLMVQRNEDWLPDIENLLEDKDVELVLVGSLHLAGKDSLLEALQRRGYTVTPYAPGD